MQDYSENCKYWFRMMSLGYLNIVKNFVTYQMNKGKSDYWEIGVNYELSRRCLAYIWGEHFFHTKMCGPIPPLC
jgi:predicted porin